MRIGECADLSFGCLRSTDPDPRAIHVPLGKLKTDRTSCHTYAMETLRAGVGFPTLMKLLGHTSSDMTMRYVEVALSDLQREFQQARAKSRHRVPAPKTSAVPTRTGLNGVIDPAGRSTCPGDVPAIVAHRCRPQSPRPALESPHQDCHRGTQTRHPLKMGRDWPVMSANRRSYLRSAFAVV
jgi:hypothetical protein